MVRQISISEDSVDDASLLHSVSASSLRSMDSVEDIGPRKRSRAMLTRKASIQSVEMDSMPDALSPKVDGRIIPLDEQVTKIEYKQQLWHLLMFCVDRGSFSYESFVCYFSAFMCFCGFFFRFCRCVNLKGSLLFLGSVF